MDFEWTEDQQLLAGALREFLEGECTPEAIRAGWESEDGHVPGLWEGLAELGLPGLGVPEAEGGLGMDEVDGVLLWEEAGRAALAAPLVSTAAVAAPLLRDAGGEAARSWLPRIAAGEARVAVAHSTTPLVADTHVADLVLLCAPAEVRALTAAELRLEAQPANDPSRRLFTLSHEPGAGEVLASGEEAGRLWAAAFDRGALACAAQALGVCGRLVSMTVDYARQRVQFGVPIGSFQAVKHQLADVQVALEYARSLVTRAAHSTARALPTRAADVSMAKLAACEAALAGARTGLQLHGAIGYTWEQDLHLWMRRAWSLDLAWGSCAYHRARLADAVVDGASPVEAFGFDATL